VATQAVRVGLQVGAKRIFAAFDDDRSVNASEHGVFVTQNPRDLPFMEHPAYDAAGPQTLLEGSIAEFRGPNLEREDPFAAAREFMTRSQATRLIIDLPGDKKLYANGGDITLYEKVKRRRLPGYKQQKVRSEPLRVFSGDRTDISGLVRARTS